METRNENSASLTRSEARILRKLRLKKQQAYEAVAKFEKLSCDQLFSSEPTQYLCLINVCSGGVGSVTTEQLSQTFSSFDGYTELRLMHGKPYSFVLFGSASAALFVRNSLHEKPCELLNGKVIFIEFVNLNQQNFMRQIAVSDKKNISGLYLSEEFVSKEFEEDILENIYATAGWIPVQHRKALHYGHSFDYDSNQVGSTSPEFPHYMDSLLDKLKECYPFVPEMEQLTVQCYPVGTGIPPHIDCHSSFGEYIVALSLGSPVIMEFKDVKSGNVVNIDLPNRSLLVLSGEARYAWSHSIRARKSDQLESGQVRRRGQRVSLTLRTINPEKICKCSWLDFCDKNIAHLEFNHVPQNLAPFIPRSKNKKRAV
ncbi:6873_t:CDS:2 [Acaulospora colombiana]|uniref:6873_t:CDS:1 n=1 Tax=Acaulospora colombiana TaxID=27376 RepID=A0ACA9L1B9_9GLOM|nr:6873_t:CDS:2 [Acaulospora colombiana]